MRLLIDQNLSPRLVRLLGDLFPDSRHVSTTGHDTVADEAIWMFARDQGFIILSRDIDYQSLSVRFGHPPKVILIRIGNCSTARVALLMRQQFERIVDMISNEHHGILIFTAEDMVTEHNGQHA